VSAALAQAAAVALRRLAATLRDALWDVDEARREAVAALETLRGALQQQNDAPGYVGFVRAHGEAVTLSRDPQPKAGMCEEWAAGWDAHAGGAS
jgi:hypothetical protein